MVNHGRDRNRACTRVELEQVAEMPVQSHVQQSKESGVVASEKERVH